MQIACRKSIKQTEIIIKAKRASKYKYVMSIVVA